MLKVDEAGSLRISDGAAFTGEVHGWESTLRGRKLRIWGHQRWMRCEGTALADFVEGNRECGRLKSEIKLFSWRNIENLKPPKVAAVQRRSPSCLRRGRLRIWGYHRWPTPKGETRVVQNVRSAKVIVWRETKNILRRWRAHPDRSPWSPTWEALARDVFVFTFLQSRAAPSSIPKQSRTLAITLWVQEDLKEKSSLILILPSFFSSNCSIFMESHLGKCEAIVNFMSYD